MKPLDAGRRQGSGRLDGLARRYPFQLLCHSAAASFGDPRTRNTLRRLCEAHQQVRSDPADVLGESLVDRARQT